MGLAEDGSIGGPVSYVQHTGSGPGLGQETTRAHCAVFDRTGKYIAAADYGNDTVYVYTCLNGSLAETGRHTLSPGSAPRIIVFSPDNKHVYTVNQIANTVTHFFFDASTGGLTEKESVTCLPEGYASSSEAAEVQFSPDFKHLYASSRGSDTIACYDVLPDGSLATKYVQSCGGQHPRHFTIASGGLFLLCGNMLSNNIAVFSRDPVSGTLSADPEFTFDAGSPTFILET
jgi:6-phosphogluconolactonase